MRDYFQNASLLETNLAERWPGKKLVASLLSEKVLEKRSVSCMRRKSVKKLTYKS